DRHAGGYPPDQGHERRVADGGGVVGGAFGRRPGEVDEDLEGARLAGVAAQVSAQFELVELVGDAGQRLEPDRVADLAHARRIAVAGDRALDHLEDRHLLLAEALAPAGLRLLAAAGRGAGLAHRGAPVCVTLRMSEVGGGVSSSKPYPMPPASSGDAPYFSWEAESGFVRP